MRKGSGDTPPIVEPEGEVLAEPNFPPPSAGSGNGSAKAAKVAKAKIGELLVERQLVTQSQLAEALLQQSASGKRLGSLLVDLGAIDELEFARTLATQLGLPMADLRQEGPEDDAIAMLPEAIARAHTALPSAGPTPGSRSRWPTPWTARPSRGSSRPRGSS